MRVAVHPPDVFAAQWYYAALGRGVFSVLEIE
jgi:hypothetical protein